MTTGIAFLGGFILASALWIVFAAVKYNQLWDELQAALTLIEQQEWHITDLESRLHPMRWSEHPHEQIKVKAHLYDKYKELIEPGTEVLGPFGEDT